MVVLLAIIFFLATSNSSMSILLLSKHHFNFSKGVVNPDGISELSVGVADNNAFKTSSSTFSKSVK